jgi:hypothetical protein
VNAFSSSRTVWYCPGWCQSWCHPTSLTAFVLADSHRNWIEFRGAGHHFIRFSEELPKRGKSTVTLLSETRRTLEHKLESLGESNVLLIRAAHLRLVTATVALPLSRGFSKAGFPGSRWVGNSPLFCVRLEIFSRVGPEATIVGFAHSPPETWLFIHLSNQRSPKNQIGIAKIAMMTSCTMNSAKALSLNAWCELQVKI